MIKLTEDGQIGKIGCFLSYHGHLLPFMGLLISIIALLLAGPFLFKLLVKFVSPRQEAFKLKISIQTLRLPDHRYS